MCQDSAKGLARAKGLLQAKEQNNEYHRTSKYRATSKNHGAKWWTSVRDNTIQGKGTDDRGRQKDEAEAEGFDVIDATDKNETMDLPKNISTYMCVAIKYKIDR